MKSELEKWRPYFEEDEKIALKKVRAQLTAMILLIRRRKAAKRK